MAFLVPKTRHDASCHVPATLLWKMCNMVQTSQVVAELKPEIMVVGPLLDVVIKGRDAYRYVAKHVNCWSHRFEAVKVQASLQLRCIGARRVSYIAVPLL